MRNIQLFVSPFHRLNLLSTAASPVFLTHPRRQRILTQQVYIYSALYFKLNLSEMSLTKFTRYWPLDHTLESLSKPSAGVLVLVTSLVSFHWHAQVYIQAYKIRDGDKVSHLIFRHFEPSSIPSHATLLIVIPTLLSGPISCTVRSPYAALPLGTVCRILVRFTVFFYLAYRLSSFHPLAKYPGPLLAKTSKWWAAYLSGTGDQHRGLKRLHDRYGDVVRIGRNPHPPFKISPLSNRLQVPTSSLFATLPLSIPYSARVACAKAQVCICVMFYTGRLADLRRD